MSNECSTVAVIGAGPAGIAAALQLKRYGINTILFEKHRVGGLLCNANLVENYPGFPCGIKGVALVELFRRQLAEVGQEIRCEHVTSLQLRDDLFTLDTDQGAVSASVVILATGTIPLKISNVEIAEETHPQIMYEVIEAEGIKGKRFAIIGSGDAAFDYALNLSNHNEVMILCRSAQPKCLPLLQERCSNSKRIENFYKINVNAINLVGDQLQLNCATPDNACQMIEADYALFAVGRDPCLELLDGTISNQIDLLVEQKLLYLIGDVQNGIYRQASISIGDGIRAAMEIYDNYKP
ncbi:NAD(P)/FAD-dependent oxidoreductase [Oligoflexia bacterium]|nr:NAD(P)/FAD-dependent oxidoreductase [Oligoflexia bacterium]